MKEVSALLTDVFHLLMCSFLLLYIALHTCVVYTMAALCLGPSVTLMIRMLSFTIIIVIIIITNSKPLETQFLFQRVSMLIQCFNSILYHQTGGEHGHCFHFVSNPRDLYYLGYKISNGCFDVPYSRVCKHSKKRCFLVSFCIDMSVSLFRLGVRPLPWTLQKPTAQFL